MNAFKKAVAGCGSCVGENSTQVVNDHHQAWPEDPSSIRPNADGTRATRAKGLTEEEYGFLASVTECSRENLQIYFDNFLKKHPSGDIDRDAFKDIMNLCFPKHDCAVVQKRLFDLYDTDGDGRIDFCEFMRVFFLLNNGSPRDILAMIFRV